MKRIEKFVVNLSPYTYCDLESPRMKLLGYIVRMGCARAVKQLLECKPEGGRKKRDID